MVGAIEARERAVMAMNCVKLPGIEWASFRGRPDEGITISNSLINGLRIEVFNHDQEETSTFQIDDATTAVQIAQVLVEYAQRIANPPGAADGGT
jgi:hypothetical protein